MKLTPELKKRYNTDRMSAREAQRQAEFIAFGPAVFQTAYIMSRRGILDFIRNSDNGATAEEIEAFSGLSPYAVKCLLEASLCIGLVYLPDEKTERYQLTKTGWFMITDPAVKVNLDFNQDVNYIGWHRLDESLEKGKPAGLEHFGTWPTIYEGLSHLEPGVQKSWLGFDHFYSDSSFGQALEIVFSQPVKSLLDVGGNTGRWAMKCLEHDPEVEVTILDLPGQIGMMKEATKDSPHASRLKGYGMDLLAPDMEFPDREFDVIWMSQFLDCFSEEQVVKILSGARRSMGPDTRLCIMETVWNRQRFEPAALCLTLTSLYFTALANGNSKMFRSEDLERLVGQAGLKVDRIYDNLGQGHSVLVCKKA